MKKNQTVPHICFCLKSFALPIHAFKGTRALTIHELHGIFFVFKCYQLLLKKNKRVSIREEQVLPSFDGKRNTLKSWTEK